MKDDILKNIAGLIDINHHENIIQLSHHLIQNSLIRNGVERKHFWQTEINIAMTCLSYLSKNVFSERYSNAKEFAAKKTIYFLIIYTESLKEHIIATQDDGYISTSRSL